jgi:hypothetical protein
MDLLLTHEPNSYKNGMALLTPLHSRTKHTLKPHS